MRPGIIQFAAVSMLLVATSGVSQALTTKEQATERLERASDVLHEIVSAPDRGIPREVIENAKCVAVVPSMLKAGFVFGGKHGKGVVTCRTENGNWSAPTFFSITGGSWGLQIGVQGVDLVMTVMNEKGMQAMLSNKFELGGSASVAAGPVGRHASAGTDWKMGTEILTYSRSRGLFAGVSVSGAWISQDRDAVVSIYEQRSSPKEILGGKVKATAEGDVFLRAVDEAAGTSRDDA